MITVLEAVNVGQEFRILLDQMFLVKREDKDSVAFSRHYKSFRLLEKTQDSFITKAICQSIYSDTTYPSEKLLHISNKSKDSKVEIL